MMSHTLVVKMHILQGYPLMEYKWSDWKKSENPLDNQEVLLFVTFPNPTYAEILHYLDTC